MNFNTKILKISIFIYVLAIISGLAPTAYSQSVYLEWVDSPLESMVINWVDDSGGNAVVAYREEGSGGWTTETGTNRSIPGSLSKRVYSVKVSGLSPGNGYEFRTDGNNEIYKFRTPPGNLNEPIKFIVAGDLLDDPFAFEQSKIDFQKVSVHAAASDPYFAVIGGDLANAEADPAKVNHWFDLFELWHENMVTDDGYLIPMVVALGNNEVPNSYGDSPEDAIFFYTFFRYPQDQWDENIPEGPIGYGRLDFNTYLSIVTLDSDHTHRIPGKQTNWLDNTLNNRKGYRHIIPVYHVAGWPTFSSRGFRFNQEAFVHDNWHPVFRDSGIRLVFEHHDHIYKRTLPIGDCNYPIEFEKDCEKGGDAEAGVIYMGGGSWGSDNTRDASIRWYHDVVDTEEIHNFVVVEISNFIRTATAIGEDGKVLDQFSDYIYFPPPNVLPADDIKEDSFRARWEKVEGATNYLLDVSTDPDFSSYWRGNDDKSVGDTDRWQFDDLDPAEIYYYRVRAQNELAIGDDSDGMIVQLVKVDPGFSTMTLSENNIPADNQTSTSITVTIVDEDNERVNNFPVKLFAVEGNLTVDNDTKQTGNNGQAIFNVRNNEPQIVTYGAVAGEVELTDKVQVTFNPIAPVALSASDVQNRQFTANWELVEFADAYILDVSTDSDFTQFINGYQNLNVGNTTSETISEINPGTTYFYRLRAISVELIGAYSETIGTTTFPDAPVATPPTNLAAVSYTANWEAAEGAKNYLLYVAADQNFEQVLQGYDGLDVGNEQQFKVDGLLPGQNYYYRLRSESESRLSNQSNIIEASTLSIDTQSSEINAGQLRVFANGEQSNEVEILIRAVNGEVQEGVTVQIIPGNGSSEIDEIRPVTNADGAALFSVTNNSVEEVTYLVKASNVDIGEFTVEFLPVDQELSLGNNFPNPFQVHSVIPLTIPSSMDVVLQVFNSIGSPVRTLIDGQLETGYYEVPISGADLAAGVYFYRLSTSEGVKTGKMVLVK